MIDAYLKTPKIYGTETITTEEVMDKLYIFQDRFGRVYEFSCWYLEIISVYAGTQLTSTEFLENVKHAVFGLH